MKRFAPLLAILICAPVHGGELGSSVPWITGATPPGTLVLNNNDYQGAFTDNPNRFQVNETAGPSGPNRFRQSIVNTERLIPTRASGGVTEYAISIGGSYSDGDARPGVNLDSIFAVQLGFGTGDNFIRARDIAPTLVFDDPANVNPLIEDYFAPGPPGPIPALRLIEHQGDTLLYQGSSTTGIFSMINFSSGQVFHLPLDIPDLPASARNFYSATDLQGLSLTDVPFTIRVTPVPEPSAMFLASVGAGCLIGLIRCSAVRRGFVCAITRYCRSQDVSFALDRREDRSAGKN